MILRVTVALAKMALSETESDWGRPGSSVVQAVQVGVLVDCGSLKA